jgi:hypothetical protein
MSTPLENLICPKFSITALFNCFFIPAVIDQIGQNEGEELEDELEDLSIEDILNVECTDIEDEKSEKYCCALCEYSTDTKRMLTLHRMSHTNPDKFWMEMGELLDHC